MKNILKENGVDNAVIAIQKYFGNDGQLDEEWFVDNIELVLDNTERLTKNKMNNRMRAYSVAYDAMLELFKSDGHELSSRQVQLGFKKLGLDYKEVLKPVVDYINEEREEEKESLNEDKSEVKKEDIEPLENFIQDLVDNFDDMTTGDLQGAVEARCMQTGEDSDKILDEIYNRISKLNESLKNTGNVKSLHEDDNDNDNEETVTDNELELNLDNEIKPNELDVEPRDLDIEDVEKGNITTEINDANQEVNTELEENDYTIDDLINGVKTLINSEKESITMCNEFLANFSAKTPKDVYEIIESYINDIKDDKLDEQTKLNNLFDALNSYAKSNESVEREDKLVDEEPKETEPIDDEDENVIVANDDDEVFNTLAEEGKLVVTNFDTLTEQYAMSKGIENTKKLKLEIRKSLINNYKILEDKNYTFVSKQFVENKLLEKEKKNEQLETLEKVKKEAEQNARETGEDTYVYQSTADGTIFFATQKPTHTALLNKVLVLGKYKVSIEHGEIYTTWLKESKQEYKYKKNLNESFDINQIKINLIGMDLNKAINYLNKLTSKTFKATSNNSDVFNGEKVYKLECNENKDYILIMVDEKEQKITRVNKVVLHDSLDEKAPCMVAGVPDGKEVESPVGGNGIVNESKEEREVVKEIDKDYEKLTIDEFEKRNKDYIDLIYKNTWGNGEIDKDLYKDIVNTLYTDSITGNINTKSDYESLNDKIEDANIETINDKVED